MFDFFRSRKQFTKIIFGILVLAFTGSLIVFFIPQPGDLRGIHNLPDKVASVDGVPITREEFTRAYENVIKRYAEQFKTQDRSIFKVLKIDQQVLNGLISDIALEREAQKMGLDATPEEIENKIKKLAVFVKDGQFVGKSAYLRILQANGYRPEDFERLMRAELIKEKIRYLMVDSVVVSPEEVKQEWLARNEKATIEYVLFDPKEVEKEVPVNDAVLKDYFGNHRDQYKTSEERKVKYFLVDQRGDLNQVKITEQELLDYYQKNPGEEEVKVSHILFKIPEKTKNEGAIRKRAEKVLQELKGGADFSALARKYSEDTASAGAGGELPYSKRQAFVPEFSKAAFNLKVGELSDIVKTSYGLHIIKLLDKRTPSFSERKSQIETTVKQKKADQEAKDVADKIASGWKQSKDSNRIAREFKLELKETPFFKSSDSSLPGLSNVVPLIRQSYSLAKPGEISSPIKLSRGYVIAQLDGIKQPGPAEFGEVKNKVETDYKKAKAEELTANKANDFIKELSSSKDLNQVAKRFNIKPNTSNEFTHTGSIDNTLAYSSEVSERAFTMKPGEVSNLIEANNRKVIFRLKSKSEFDKEKFEKEKESIAQQLLTRKQENFFQAYTHSVVEKMKKEKRIQINDQLMKRLT